ncbi:molybdenum cofactor biosynthesis protein A [Alkaliphilus metalliredigens QYMF]|uniref:GTP 3',8-cyclase n=1 Tax=Alkaliphilus metalliredigens (strain QYMF) TaxID=293826 RepID=MOAA_ALKMQ|nr:GTP 3',8-cyclase MoaA [Alkaliphilus metalliredigens]A6TVF9.1 RecName: Full=GTP 3',8-cyclase; AltName: Full=Molybdenum cofactor biosynthesis protein A [Alkaliphilus metalliredigens QYMF]ABR50177.1 molybdenum cofactor biosynthesis protein A [Alkaliphilus metalliredigens QYMF]
MKDTFQRSINYMRISITDLCNLRCQYCMPEKGIYKKTHQDILTLEEIEQIVRIGAENGINKVRITGGEPLVRKGVIGLIKNISNIPGIQDIALTTNGLLIKKYGEALKDAGLKRINISIDSLRPDRYKEITRGGDLSQVLEGIQEALRLGMTPVKLNVVVIGGYNEDEIEDFANLTVDDPIDVRFIELMPIGEASGWAKDRFLSNEEVKSKIEGLVPIITDATSPARLYRLPGAKGRVGFINPISSHFCESCNRIRVTSDGKLKPCLHSNHEIDLLRVARENPEQIGAVLSNGIQLKPEKHYLYTNKHEMSARSMSEIGG